MADISIIARLVNGIVRNVDIASNTLVVNEVKVGGASGTILTKAILDNLVSLQDGSDFADGTGAHTHDGRYYTESELGDSTASSGSDLIGDDNTYSNFTPAAATVKGALSGIDAAIATAGGTEFADDVFRVTGSVDATKKIALEADGLTTSTTRTITMPDANVDLGDIATNTSDISTNAGNISTNSSNISTNSTDIGDLQTLSGVAANATDLGTFTGDAIPDAQTIKQALQALETYSEASRSLIQNFEWQESSLDYIADNTLAPPTEVNGDRYILSHDGGAPNAAWDGASAGDIVEFDGSVWVATTPTTGMFVSVDDDQTGLYVWGGSSWDFKAFESTTASTGLTKSGFDIQLADAAASGGIVVSSGAISVSLADASLEFNAGNLKVKAKTAAGATTEANALALDASDGLYIKVDPTGGIEGNAQGGSGVESLRLSTGAAGNGITGGGGSALAVEADATGGANLATAVNVSSNGVAVKIDDTTVGENGSQQLEVKDNSLGSAKLTTGVADQDTITGGNGSALAVQHAPQVRNAEVAGEGMGTGLKAVRYGISSLDTPETAGRVYLADPTELSLVKTGGNQDPFHVIGLCIAASETAGTGIDVVKGGLITATAHGLTIGQPCWLDSSGAVTSTEPSTPGEAVVKVGVPKDANTIDVNIQIMGVN